MKIGAGNVPTACVHPGECGDALVFNCRGVPERSSEGCAALSLGGGARVGALARDGRKRRPGARPRIRSRWRSSPTAGALVRWSGALPQKVIQDNALRDPLGAVVADYLGVGRLAGIAPRAPRLSLARLHPARARLIDEAPGAGPASKTPTSGSADLATRCPVPRVAGAAVRAVAVASAPIPQRREDHVTRCPG